MDMLSMFQNFILKEIHEEYALHSVSYLSTTPAKKNWQKFSQVFISKGLLCSV